MDCRVALGAGTRLLLDDEEFILQDCIGRGGNALVYQAYYFDHLQKDLRHFVLIKELFPYQREGLIRRLADGRVSCTPEARDWFLLHRESFLRGNRMHLKLISQRDHGELAGGNLNSYEANDTCYSVLADGGGYTLGDALESGFFAPTALNSVFLIQNLLNVLAVYHQNELLHLDISPGNILLLPLDKNLDEQRRRVMPIDYNSMWSRQELQSAPGLQLSVKEGYSPPELRLQDRRSIGPWTDLYAVCAVFRELWTSPHPEEIPATAKNKAEAILRKGLRNAPQSRYQAAGELQADLTELLNRLMGLGVTHAALWEQSRSQFQKLVQNNPHFAYLKEELLFDTPPLPTSHVQLAGQGGMGKTTTLFLWWKSGIQAYKPDEPVNIYIPLYRYHAEDVPFLRRMLIERLHFDSRVSTVRDALQKLDDLLDTPSSGRTVRLLLDGLNEATGDLRPLNQEILELSKMHGVTVVLTSRVPCPAFSWTVHIMPPLGGDTVRKALSLRGLLYPAGQEQQELLSNPMLLSLYIQAAGQEGKNLAAAGRDEIIRLYIESLADKQTVLDAEQAARTHYAIQVFLPYMAQFMRSARTLPPGRLYVLLRGQYHKVRTAAFRKAYPGFIGQLRSILADTHSPDDWFAALVEDVLLCRLALLMKDEQGQYCFAHPLFQEYFSKCAKEVKRNFRSAGLWYAAPRALACLITVGALVFAGLKAIPRSYPATAQEQTQVKNSLDGLMSVMTSLDSQITSTRGAFEQWLAKPDDEALIAHLARCLEQAQAYLPYESKRDRIADYFEKWPVAVDTAPVRVLLLAPQDYYDWTQAIYTMLQTKLLAPGSVYPLSDKIVVVSAYVEYIDIYSRWCFSQIMKIIEPLNREGRGKALEYLRASPVFFALVASMRLDPPTQTQREELMAAIESLHSQGTAALSPIRQTGLDVTDLMSIK